MTVKSPISPASAKKKTGAKADTAPRKIIAKKSPVKTLAREAAAAVTHQAEKTVKKIESGTKKPVKAVKKTVKKAASATRKAVVKTAKKVSSAVSKKIAVKKPAASQKTDASLRVVKTASKKAPAPHHA
jgi:hypothetical protein